MKIGSLFTGYGGLDIGVQQVFGGETVWVSDIEPGPVLHHKHHHPNIPNLGDITQVDWQGVEPVDIIVGGSPCQDLSYAGRRAGLTGARSGLWWNMAEAIQTLTPRLVVWENVQGALRPTKPGEYPAVTIIEETIQELGYQTGWVQQKLSNIGGCHHRNRVFLLGWKEETPHSLVNNPPPTPVGAKFLPTPTASLGRSTGSGVGTVRNMRPGRQRAVVDYLTYLAEPGELHVDWGKWPEEKTGIDSHTGLVGYPPPGEVLVRGPRGGRRFNTQFIEWMMGVPEGYVTGLEREGVYGWRDSARMLGNGVVPQQAAAALSRIISDNWKSCKPTTPLAGPTYVLLTLLGVW